MGVSAYRVLMPIICFRGGRCMPVMGTVRGGSYFLVCER